MREKYRHELKFIITNGEYEQLRKVLRPAMRYDTYAGENGHYHIRSMYLDDLYHTAYLQKGDGVEIRKKYRIRNYNCGVKPLSLECKYKYGAYIYKESVPLTVDEYQQILRRNTQFLLKRSHPMAREFSVDAAARIIRPCVIVAYDREPLVNDVGAVRITFDKNLTAISPGEDIFDSNAPGYSVLSPGSMILEVKYTGILPVHLQKIFDSYSFVRLSASKFCMCVDRVNHTLR